MNLHVTSASVFNFCLNKINLLLLRNELKSSNIEFQLCKLDFVIDKGQNDVVFFFIYTIFVIEKVGNIFSKI